MNITLKSLLITSALTLPAVFATHDDVLASDSDTHPAATATAAPADSTPAATPQWSEIIELYSTKSFEQLLQLAIDSKHSITALSEKEAGVLVDSINSNSTLKNDEKMILRVFLPTAKQSDILLAANQLHRIGGRNIGGRTLGNIYHDEAAYLYQCFAKYPTAKPDDIQWAASRLGELRDEYQENDFPKAWDFHEHVIDLYKSVGTHTTATLAVIQTAANGLSALVKLYSGKLSLLWYKPAPHIDEAWKLRDLAEKHPEKRWKYIAQAAALFPPAALTPDIRYTTHKLQELRGKCLSLAADLYQKAGTHGVATSEDILEAADGFRDLARMHPAETRYTEMVEVLEALYRDRTVQK